MIKLVEKGVYGVSKPKVVVTLLSDKTDCEFIGVYNDKEIDLNVAYRQNVNNRDDSKYVINISADLFDNTGDFVLFYVENGNRIKIAKIKNRTINRLFNKVFKAFRKIVIDIKNIIRLFIRGMRFLWREYHFLVPPALVKKYVRDFINRVKKGGLDIFYNPMIQIDYEQWLKNNEKEQVIQPLSYNPLISILIPVYNVDPLFLDECIKSILKQSYQNFEICLADDCSTNEDTIKKLKMLETKDNRIKVVYREKNGHISAATNDALKIASGEFIALMDNDDLLHKDALYENVKVLNTNPGIDFIYSDEDKINTSNRRCYPNFKPDYSPDTLLSLNYISHLAVIRKTLIDNVGGFREGYEGAQDYDLYLRITEQTDKIYHIPKILYHWRMIETSTAVNPGSKNYAYLNGKKALESAMERRGIKAKIELAEDVLYYKVKYDISDLPLVSIIIPTKDYVDILKNCIDSIIKKTTYRNYEIIIINNGSEKQETISYLDKIQREYKIKVVDIDSEFNYSYLNNQAVKQAKGEFIVLLNNDTEVITEKWIEEMLGYAKQKHVGTVGPKLLYPDGTIQHAGVVTGLGGIASHVYIGATRDFKGLYGRLDVPYNYSAVTAACLMVEKKKFEEVGGLDETLKVAYNDIDFNLKLLEKGYYNVFIPYVELTHYESKTRGLDTTTEKYRRFLFESKTMDEKWENLYNDRFYNPNYSLRGWFMLDKENSDGKKK